MNDQPNQCGHAQDGDRHVCRHGPLGEHSGDDIICFDGVGFSYGNTVALREITMHVEAGCCLGIIGPNGGGKTTLLKVMLGLLEGYRGSITVDGVQPRDVCRRGDVVGYVAQNPTADARFPVSVRQVVHMGLVGKAGLVGRPSRDDRRHADELLDQLGIADLRDRPIGDLSGGQRQRAFIARALAARPRILLLDEPLVGIDVAGQRMFAQLVRTLHESMGLTVLVVSHDLRAIAGTCGKVAVLSRTIHYHDSADGLTSDLLTEVFQHDIAPMLG